VILVNQEGVGAVVEHVRVERRGAELNPLFGKAGDLRDSRIVEQRLRDNLHFAVTLIQSAGHTSNMSTMHNNAIYAKRVRIYVSNTSMTGQGSRLSDLFLSMCVRKPCSTCSTRPKYSEGYDLSHLNSSMR
jgi:hypothetical protein